MKREKGGPEKPPRSAGQRSYGGLGATGRLPLSTDKAPRGRRGTLSPAAAAAGTEAAAAHGAGSSASEEGAEPRGLAPHSPHPSCSQRRPVGLWQQKRRSHEEQGAELAPRRADATKVKTAKLPPQPRLLRGTSPDAGRWQPGAQEWEGPRRGRRAEARVPGLSAAASGSTRPEEGTSLRGRPSLDAEGGSLEASKPEERPPPSPRPPRPPRAWRTSSPLWTAPGAEEGGNCGEGRAAHRGARAPLLL